MIKNFYKCNTTKFDRLCIVLMIKVFFTRSAIPQNVTVYVFLWHSNAGPMKLLFTRRALYHGFPIIWKLADAENWTISVRVLLVLVVLWLALHCGKVEIFSLCIHCKWWLRICCWSYELFTGSNPWQREVANASANSPQSLLPLCHRTLVCVIVIDFFSKMSYMPPSMRREFHMQALHCFSWASNRGDSDPMASPNIQNLHKLPSSRLHWKVFSNDCKLEPSNMWVLLSK